jgi:hypothetical protein
MIAILYQLLGTCFVFQCTPKRKRKEPGCWLGANLTGSASA